jgi:hypothetical protein
MQFVTKLVIPTTRDLKNLSLRAAIALSLRATQRVAQLLQNSSELNDTASSTIDVRVFNIGNLIVKSFCDGTLHRDSTPLAEIMTDSKWDLIDENSYNNTHYVLRSGNYIFSATMQARFGHSVEEDVPVFSTAEYVINLLQMALSAALTASVTAGEHYKSGVLEGIARDYRNLLVVSTALFPAYGARIDTTPDGPLGDLWCGSIPRVTSPPECQNNNLERSVSPAPYITHPTTSPPAAERAGSPPEGYLYKYVSFDTLVKVLENSTLRFSRVSSFNDPFDGQILPIRKFGWKHFFKALRDETSRLVRAKDEPIYQLPKEISKDAAISAAAQIAVAFMDDPDRKTTFFLKDTEVDGTVVPLSELLRPMIYLAQHGKLGSVEDAISCLNGILDRFEDHRLQFDPHDSDRRIIPALANMMQVLCLTEVPNSLLMWSHYAGCHSGAVLKFDTFCDRAGYFSEARPVVYEKQLPSFEQPRDLARRYLGLACANADVLSRQFFTKGAEWAYEKEWRIMATNKMKEQGEFISFDSKSLSAIYLGCRFTKQEVQRILDLVINKRLPTDIYMGVKDETEFALSFVPLSNGRTRSSATPTMNTDERSRLYRRCLDAYFDFFNDSTDDLYGERRRLRAEGTLADFGPQGSIGLFRKMIEKLEETANSRPKITVDREKEPKEYQRQLLTILKPSAESYGALEDLLKTDLADRGGTLPDRAEPANTDTETNSIPTRDSP